MIDWDYERSRCWIQRKSPSAGEAPSVDAVRLSPDAENIQLKSDLQQLRERHEALVSALAQVVEMFGPWHDDDCPCDDTCDCSSKPIHDAINAALTHKEQS